jgi:hypothetical protein
MSNEAYFRTRFEFDPRRDLLWRTLCRHYFSDLISPSACVLELGAGYGHFINHVRARRRIAVDAWSGFTGHVQPGVEARVGSVTDLSFLDPASVDFVFASNLFEHLTQEELSSVLQQLKVALGPEGTVNIVQPNFYYAYRAYFDDYTHRTVYSHVSLCDFLEAHGFAIVECRKRFLPLSLKSRWPVSSALIRLYLASPWKPLAKQMFVRARVQRA